MLRSMSINCPCRSDRIANRWAEPILCRIVLTTKYIMYCYDLKYKPDRENMLNRSIVLTSNHLTTSMVPVGMALVYNL